ncbi:hypothetical protein A2U01_0063065, partial [Trifolium medium]|nr:hypothetical protein [Trifolium medium]
EESRECLLLNSHDDDSETPLLSQAPSSNAITDVGDTVVLLETLLRSNAIAKDDEPADFSSESGCEIDNGGVSEEGSSVTTAETGIPSTAIGTAWGRSYPGGGPVYSAAIEYCIPLT